VSGFIKFLETHAKLDIRKFAEESWPGFYEKNHVKELEIRAQAAVAAAILKSEKSLKVAKESGNNLTEMTVFHGFASRGLDCQSGDEKPFDFFLRRFLAHYFMCPTIFEFDGSVCQQMLDGSHQSEFFDAEKIKSWITDVVSIIKESLMRALPEKAVEHLAMDLQRTTVCGRKHAKAGVQVSKSDWLTLFQKGKQAILRRATGETSSTKELQHLLDSQGLPPTAYQDGESLLCLAASYGDTYCVELLYERGGNLNEAQPQGQTNVTALEMASWMGHEPVVDFLLAHGAFFGRALHYAAKGGHSALVKRLLDCHAHPEMPVDGHTPLMVALLSQHDEIIEKLVIAGAKVEARLDAAVCSKMGLNPESTLLHYAAKHGFGDSIQAIVHKWPDGLECKNKANETPLDLAPLYVRPLVKPGQLDSLRVMRQATIAGANEKDTSQELKQLFADGKGDPNAQGSHSLICTHAQIHTYIHTYIHMHVHTYIHCMYIFPQQALASIR
jgi:ankyrin repeat protein